MTLPTDRRHDPPGRRTMDQPKRDRPRHWLAIQASRHPVSMALLVAVAIAMIPLVMVLDQQNKIQDQQDTIGHQQRQIGRVYTQLQLSRRATTVQFCQSINGSAAANNRTTDVITRYVMSQTRASRRFEPVYRQLGLPPYKKRLAQAEKLTGDLARQKVPVIDCTRLGRQIDRQLRLAGVKRPTSRGRLGNYPDSHIRTP